MFSQAFAMPSDGRFRQHHDLAIDVDASAIRVEPIHLNPLLQVLSSRLKRPRSVLLLGHDPEKWKKDHAQTER
jgi:hypothetical protein